MFNLPQNGEGYFFFIRAASYDSCSNCGGSCTSGCGNASSYPDVQAGCAAFCDTKPCQNNCSNGCGSGCASSCKESCHSGCVTGGCIRYCNGLATIVFLFFILHLTIF